MGKRRSPEERVEERRREELARAATTDAELAPFLTDPNQAIRSVAAMNPHASAELLDRFAEDRFWGVRAEVVRHPRTARSTVLRLLARDARTRGVVHTAARQRLEAEGVAFGTDGLPAPSAER
jgi:hypothetical protein